MTAHPRPRRAQRLATALVAGLVALAPAASHACGACIEDKAAATYDHAVAMRAAARGDVMMYCEVAGAFDPQRLTQAVRRVRGIKADSVRIAAQPAALSFALDPSRLSPEAAVAATQRGLATGTRLTIVRRVEAPG